MPFSQGSRAALAFGKEASFAGALATPNSLQLLNTATHDLSPSIEYIPNPVLRSDRQRSAPNPGNRNATGSLTGPLHWNAYDGLLEGVFCNPWTTIGGASTLTNGVIRNTYMFERHQQDNNIFGLGKGMFINTFAATFAAGANIDCSFEMIGKQFTWETASQDSDGYTPAVSANSLMKPGIGVVKEGGNATPLGIVTSATLTFNNNADPNFVYGNNYMPDFSLGDFSVTGTLTMYWPNQDIIKKYVDGTPSSLEITARDGANQYVFNLPRITYTGGTAPITQAGSITIDMPFEATLDPTTGYTARITRGTQT